MQSQQKINKSIHIRVNPIPVEVLKNTKVPYIKTDIYLSICLSGICGTIVSMRERHTGEVISTLYTLLKTEVAGKSPMTVAATKIGTSYQTLRRKLLSGKLSLNEFEMLCDLLERDPAAVYSHPDEAKRKQK
ncbi:hypothetical protein WM014_08650 [Bifidobacterium mongoliense]|uniref:hypothetical protein n=2 Tax=Bifidobacterium mongoliense TaxID=518643 RepID=UPI0030EF4548